MGGVTERLVKQVERALLLVPNGGAVGYDVFWERRPAMGPHALALVLVLVVSNPQVGQPALTAGTELPTAWMDQDAIDKLVADGTVFLRTQQRALLS